MLATAFLALLGLFGLVSWVREHREPKPWIDPAVLCRGLDVEREWGRLGKEYSWATDVRGGPTVVVDGSTERPTLLSLAGLEGPSVAPEFAGDERGPCSDAAGALAKQVLERALGASRGAAVWTWAAAQLVVHPPSAACRETKTFDGWTAELTREDDGVRTAPFTAHLVIRPPPDWKPAD